MDAGARKSLFTTVYFVRQLVRQPQIIGKLLRENCILKLTRRERRFETQVTGTGSVSKLFAAGKTFSDQGERNETC